MTTIINATVTEDAVLYYPQFFMGQLGAPGTPTNVVTPVWDPRWKYVKVGEGGWMDSGSGQVPRTPSPSLRKLSGPAIQDLDAVVDATRSAPDQRYTATGRATFQKTLGGGDVTFVAPSTAKVRLFLDFGDFNDDGFGNSPELWEVGVFSDHPTIASQLLMVAYGTFPKVVKTAGIQVERFVRIRFGAT